MKRKLSTTMAIAGISTVVGVIWICAEFKQDKPTLLVVLLAYAICIKGFDFILSALGEK